MLLIPNNLIIAGRYLFLSERGMTAAGGQPRTGIAIFCLEPENPKAFTNPDVSVCPGETVTYTIPDVQYETGYKWTYSGTGIQYSVNNGAFQNYTGPVMNTTANASSIKIRFTNGATGGTLTVQPYNTCNTSSDYLYAKTQSIAITLNPIPDVTFNADSLRFTCAVDSLALVAHTTAPTATFQWFYPNTATNISINDTLSIHASGSGSSAIYPTGRYYMMVTNLVTGCKNTDSIFVSTDLVPPTITQDSLHTVPSAFTCATTQMQLFASAGNSTIYWTSVSDLQTQFPNPHSIYSLQETDFIAHATSNSNGCEASQQFTITTDTATAAGYLQDYPGFLTALILDTLNCYDPQLSLLCGVQPSDPAASVSSAYWVSSGSTDLSLSEADTVNLFNQTHTYSFVTLNGQNSCRDTFEVTVLFDFDRPFVVDYQPTSSLNCSVDTLTLFHPQTGGAVTESWLDASENQTGSQALFVQSVGDYVYEVRYNQNGCTSRDTVTVLQLPEMYLTGSPDTVICPGETVILTTIPVNIDEEVTYLWSNGETNATTHAVGGIDSLLVVTATSASGCIGRDTIWVSITDPVQIETAAFVSCGESKGSLQVTQVTGGAGNYQFAIDGNSFSGNSFFDSLSTGIHSLYVKDALGCVYTFQDTLDASASAPAMDFLVSTYSGSGDTLAIVNSTVFAGFDSTSWTFPPGTNIFYQADSLALIQLPDTGWFELTLIGYDDTCQFTFSKYIYSGVMSPVYPSNYNSVRIQTLVAYPNSTDGLFTVELVFGIEQHFVLMVTNALSQPIPGMEYSGLGKTFSLPFAFPENTPSGSYHIHVVSDYDARQFTLILN